MSRQSRHARRSANQERDEFYRQAGATRASIEYQAQACDVCGDPGPPVVGADKVAACDRCGQPVGQLRQEGRDHGDMVIKLEGLMLPTPPGRRDPHAGRLLAAYDPRRAGGWNGDLYVPVHLVTTDDYDEAIRFDGMAAARREWMRWDTYIRPDGQPSRPLTAWTVNFHRIPAR